MDSYQVQPSRISSSSASHVSHAQAPSSQCKPGGRTVFINAERSPDILNDRYRMGGILGISRLSIIYRAFDLQRQLPCAIKLVPPGADQTLLPERRLRHEAEVMSQLRHPNIHEVRELSRDENGNSFLVMEMLQGRNLQQLLEEQSPLPLARVIEILREVAAGLQYAHDREIIHGDLKPSSIFFHEEKGDEPGAESHGTVIKLLDFGLARVLTAANPDGAPTITQGKVIGTPAYLAPEALFPDRSRVDARSDQWALAVIAYRMLTGRLPFFHENPPYLGALIREREPESIANLVPQLPTCVALAIHTALAKDKWLRFGSVQDFLRALEGLPPQRARPSIGTCAPTVERICPELIALCLRDDAPREAIPELIAEENSTRRCPQTGKVRQLFHAEQQASMVTPEEVEASGATKGVGPAVEVRSNKTAFFLSMVMLLSAVTTGLATRHFLARRWHSHPETATRLKPSTVPSKGLEPEPHAVMDSVQAAPAVWQSLASAENEPAPASSDEKQAAILSTAAPATTASAPKPPSAPVPAKSAPLPSAAQRGRTPAVLRGKPALRKLNPPPLRDASDSVAESAASTADSQELHLSFLQPPFESRGFLPKRLEALLAPN